jgi:hypothetical protein
VLAAALGLSAFAVARPGREASRGRTERSRTTLRPGLRGVARSRLRVSVQMGPSPACTRNGAAAHVIARFQDEREPPTTFLSWSPDGRRILYVDSSATCSPRTWTEAAYPESSRRGRRSPRGRPTAGRSRTPVRRHHDRGQRRQQSARDRSGGVPRVVTRWSAHRVHVGLGDRRARRDCGRGRDVASTAATKSPVTAKSCAPADAAARTGGG